MKGSNFLFDFLTEYFISIIKILQNSQIELSIGYKISSLILAFLVGVICAVLIIVPAFLTKKNKGFAIVTGIAQIAGVLATQAMVHSFMNLKFLTVITGSTSEIYAEAFKFFIEQMIALIPYVLYSYVILAVFVITLIYFIKTIKIKPKLFGILALVIHVIRSFAFSPIPTQFAAFGPLTEGALRFNDIVGYLLYLLPALLIFVGGLINVIKAKKAQ